MSNATKKPEEWLKFIMKERKSYHGPNKYKYWMQLYRRAADSIPVNEYGHNNTSYAKILVDFAKLQAHTSEDEARSIFHAAKNNVKHCSLVYVAWAQFELLHNNAAKCKKLLNKGKLLYAEPKYLLDVALENLANGNRQLIDEETEEHTFTELISKSTNKTEDDIGGNFTNNGQTRSDSSLESSSSTFWLTTDSSGVEGCVEPCVKPCVKPETEAERKSAHVRMRETISASKYSSSGSSVNESKQRRVLRRAPLIGLPQRVPKHIENETDDILEESEQFEKGQDINGVKGIDKPERGIISKNEEKDFIYGFSDSSEEEACPGRNKSRETRFILEQREPRGIDNSKGTLAIEKENDQENRPNCNKHEHHIGCTDKKELVTFQPQVDRLSQQSCPAPGVIVVDKQQANAFSRVIALQQICPVSQGVSSHNQDKMPTLAPVTSSNEECFKNGTSSVPNLPCYHRSHPRIRPGVQTDFPTPTALACSSNSILVVNGKVYNKLNTIGKGGSSKVYTAFDGQKTYAIKYVNVEDSEPAVIQSYVNEITLLKRLQGHESIIKLYDWEMDDVEKVIKLVLEIGSIDLAGYLKKNPGKITIDFIKVCWKQVLDAVQVVHEEGIVHSDLKPANFLLVEGNLKLIDFGIARVIQGDTTSFLRDSQIGTLNYMSPEALRDTSQTHGQNEHHKPIMKIRRASDVWSLGCILYLMVYGKTPFQHILNHIQKWKCIMDATYQIEFPPIENQDLVDTMKGCLKRNPRERYTIPQLQNHWFLTGRTTARNVGDQMKEINSPTTLRTLTLKVNEVKRTQEAAERKHQEKELAALVEQLSSAKTKLREATDKHEERLQKISLDHQNQLQAKDQLIHRVTETLEEKESIIQNMLQQLSSGGSLDMESIQSCPVSQPLPQKVSSSVTQERKNCQFHAGSVEGYKV